MYYYDSFNARYSKQRNKPTKATTKTKKKNKIGNQSLCNSNSNNI